MPKVKQTSPTSKQAETTKSRTKQPSINVVKPTVHPPKKTRRKNFREIMLTRISPVLAASIVLMFITSIELYEVIKLDDIALRLPLSSLSYDQKIPAATSLASLRSLDKCQNGMTLNIVAHEDDDLLFMNPAVANAITGGKCIRTVFVTAGDGGHAANYWQGRERGAKAAYAAMYRRDSIWQSTKTIINGHGLEVATLHDVPSMALLFLHLPDGSVSGDGFRTDQNETLKKLRAGSIPSIHTIDGKTSYTAKELINLLATIMNLDRPDAINTQASNFLLEGADHSDHQVVGYLTDRARHAYRATYTFSTYLGYQSNQLPINLSKADSVSKQAVFAAYERYDTAICASFTNCQKVNTYAAYLQRQYLYTGQVIGTGQPQKSNELPATSVDRVNY